MREIELQIQATKDKSQSFGQYLKDSFNEFLQWMTLNVKAWIQAFKDFWTIIQAVGQFFDNLAQKIANFILKVYEALKALRDFIRESRESWIWSWLVSAGVSLAKSVIKWKAVWWPVSANTPYIVGEEWPELFVPNTSWNIVPNDQMWNITVNVNFGWVAVNNWADEVSLAETITETITRNLELYKKGIY